MPIDEAKMQVLIKKNWKNKFFSNIFNTTNILTNEL